MLQTTFQQTLPTYRVVVYEQVPSNNPASSVQRFLQRFDFQLNMFNPVCQHTVQGEQDDEENQLLPEP